MLAIIIALIGLYMVDPNHKVATEQKALIASLEAQKDIVCEVASSSAEKEIEYVTEYVDKIRYVNNGTCAELEEYKTDLRLHELALTQCRADNKDLLMANEDYIILIERLQSECINF